MQQNQTDTDSQGPFATGTGFSEQRPNAIHQINPNWVADGYGLRGPQRPVVPDDTRRSPIQFPMIDNSVPRPAAQQGELCDPGEGADTSLKYIKATEWDTDHWVCVWLPTCAGTCDV